jgi:sugar/nucleoside kinase (ribokinase family)
MPYYQSIMEGIKEEIIPEITKKQRKLFMDFGNVKKRSDQDLKLFSKSLAELEKHFKITVSLNRTEALDTARALGIENNTEKNSFKEKAKEIRKEMGISNFVLHTNSFAISADQSDIQKLKQPYCKNPVLTTGAGDTFNGGYILGLLISDDSEIRLATASAAAGYFIRNGRPPKRKEMRKFLEEYPDLFKDE